MSSQARTRALVFLSSVALALIPFGAQLRAEELADSDGDGVDDAIDCRPADSTVWSVPSPARSLIFPGPGKSTLSWTPPVAPGGSFLTYDLLRASGGPFFGAADCLTPGTSATTGSDAQAPASVFFYLVRAHTVCGSNLGTNSAGVPRVGSACLRANGETCTGDGECLSGFCRDGVCCGTSCTGVCARCDQTGSLGACQPIPAGQDPDAECPTQTPTTCGSTGVCSGSDACQLHPSGTVCAARSCASTTTSNNPDACNGGGTCVDGGITACTPYACNAGTGACRTTCAITSDCAAGHACAGGQCLRSDGQSCTLDTQCASGACCSGFCRNRATDVNNCGACGLQCTNAHGTTACVGSACSPACSAGWGSCDSNPNNGCERSLTTLTDCGNCSVPCSIPNATETCSTGTCAFVACNTGFSTCDGNTANGCEVSHGAASNSCGGAEYLGSACGDDNCGFLCPSVGFTAFTNRSGLSSRWFRVTAAECSSCTAGLSHRVTLNVPPSVDYDLFIHSVCGTIIASSTNGVGVTEQLTVTRGETAGDDTFSYWIEVRWFGGASCSSWGLFVDRRNCS